MKNFFFNIILYCAGALALSIIALFVIYKLATIIAIALTLVVAGLLIGPPIFYVLKRKYIAAIREESSKY